MCNEIVTVHTEKYKGYNITINYDDDLSLNELVGDYLDNDRFLVSYHRNFYVPHTEFTKDVTSSIFAKGKHPKYHTFPLRMYSHGGVALSLSNDTYPFNCQFDSCWSGMVFVSKKVHRLSDKAKEQAQYLVNIYNYALAGDVYRYSITKDGEVVDSCGGYLGEYKNCLESAKGSVDHLVRTKEVFGR